VQKAKFINAHVLEILSQSLNLAPYLSIQFNKDTTVSEAVCCDSIAETCGYIKPGICLHSILNSFAMFRDPHPEERDSDFDNDLGAAETAETATPISNRVMLQNHHHCDGAIENPDFHNLLEDVQTQTSQTTGECTAALLAANFENSKRSSENAGLDDEMVQVVKKKRYPTICNSWF